MSKPGLSDKQIYCFMDYETTGIDTSVRTSVLPIQIGIVFADRDMDVFGEYTELIKWQELMWYEKWPDTPALGDTTRAAKVHKIPLSDVKEKGKWAYQVRQELTSMINSIKMGIGTEKRPVIISDAPNFETFMTEMIYGSRQNRDWPFYFNSWSVYPLFQLFGVKPLYGSKPHDALGDAQLLHEGMKEVWEKAKRLKML